MKTISGPGYFLGAHVASGAVTIGGACTLQGAVSPNTGLPLTQHGVVKLGTNGLFVPGWTVPELHFLYSWKCCISQGDFSYKYIEGRLEIVEYTSGHDDFDGFPYENYPIVFPPVHFRLHQLSLTDQELIDKLNDPETDSGLKFETKRAEQLSIPTHQFGGVPFLLDPQLDGKRCISCGVEMTLIASIGNCCYSRDEGFFGNDFVQLLFFGCATCHIISAINTTS